MLQHSSEIGLPCSDVVAYGRVDYDACKAHASPMRKKLGVCCEAFAWSADVELPRSLVLWE